MNLNARLERLAWLGEFFRAYFLNKNNSDYKDLYHTLRYTINNEIHSNPWFTEEQIEYALKHWGNILNTKHISEWANIYDKKLLEENKTKNVLVIAAGNIPLVAFHDVLSVFLCGHRCTVKVSSKDKNLLKTLINIWGSTFPEINERIFVSEGIVNNFDAVIATGSNQSLRYFETYFGNYPHIFRGHRNSIAILDGTETEDELKLLSDDVFLYFGLGCRNVSKIFVPENYNFNSLFSAFKKWEHIFYHHYYLSNYEYQKTVYILNKTHFVDGGFFMLKESEEISSPIGVIFYEYYSDIRILAAKNNAWSSQVQCIVCKEDKYIKGIQFGYAQKPKLWDYADNVDIINFLIRI